MNYNPWTSSHRHPSISYEDDSSDLDRDDSDDSLQGAGLIKCFNNKVDSIHQKALKEKTLEAFAYYCSY